MNKNEKWKLIVVAFYFGSSRLGPCQILNEINSTIVEFGPRNLTFSGMLIWPFVV